VELAMKNMVVMKFGGSSVESAQAIQRVASIVRGEIDRHPVVVVSAMGKTTDALLRIARLTAARKQEAAAREISKLRHFHLREACRLVRAAQAVWLDLEINDLFEELETVLVDVANLGDLTPRLQDAILSFGERLSSAMVTAGLRQSGITAAHLDARQVIVTDDKHTEAAPFTIETYARLRRKVSTEHVTVMGGFIGATRDGIPTTLGRGGSDYTAALVGAALAVDEIQIWTDVDGMLTGDPRLVSGAHCLRSISYAEAEQLAKAGAKVLHPATVLPAIRQNIPITIRNSRNPAAPGTRIVRENPCNGTVLSIACRSRIAVLQIAPHTAPLSADFGAQLWEEFQRSMVQFDLIATSSKEISLIVDEGSLSPEFLKRLENLAEVKVEEHRALVTLVGQDVTRNPSNLARASHVVRSAGVQLAWCSDSRFAFLAAADAVERVAQTLHREFFHDPDPALFIADRSVPAKSDENLPVVKHSTPLATVNV
jgi:aspartate kinase